MVKKVCTRWSPSGPDFGVSANLTRAAYVPSLNFTDLVRTSVCVVDAPVPAVGRDRGIRVRAVVEVVEQGLTAAGRIGRVGRVRGVVALGSRAPDGGAG